MGMGVGVCYMKRCRCEDSESLGSGFVGTRGFITRFNSVVQAPPLLLVGVTCSFNFHTHTHSLSFLPSTSLYLFHGCRVQMMNLEHIPTHHLWYMSIHICIEIDFCVHLFCSICSVFFYHFSYYCSSFSSFNGTIRTHY
jgi:hypothetical protein